MQEQDNTPTEQGDSLLGGGGWYGEGGRVTEFSMRVMCSEESRQRIWKFVTANISLRKLPDSRSSS